MSYVTIRQCLQMRITGTYFIGSPSTRESLYASSSLTNNSPLTSLLSIFFKNETNRCGSGYRSMMFASGSSSPASSAFSRSSGVNTARPIFFSLSTRRSVPPNPPSNRCHHPSFCTMFQMIRVPSSFSTTRPHVSSIPRTVSRVVGSDVRTCSRCSSRE